MRIYLYCSTTEDQKTSIKEKNDLFFLVLLLLNLNNAGGWCHDGDGWKIERNDWWFSVVNDEGVLSWGLRCKETEWRWTYRLWLDSCWMLRLAEQTKSRMWPWKGVGKVACWVTLRHCSSSKNSVASLSSVWFASNCFQSREQAIRKQWGRYEKMEPPDMSV